MVPPVQGAGGDRDEQDVVGERPDQALLDGGHGAPRQGDGGDDAAQVAADQGDVGGGDGDVGAGADGDAEVGGGQGGGVVDAVADHRDHVPVGLEGGDPGGLVGREDLGDDVVDADLSGDGVRGGGVVAGHHPDLQAEGLQLGDGLGGVGLDGVGDGHQAGQGAVDGDVHRGAAGRRRPAGLAGQRGGVDPRAAMCAWLPTAMLVDAIVALMPCPGWAAKSVAGCKVRPRVAGGGHDGLPDRVLASDLGGGHQGQQLVGVVTGQRRDVLEGGSAVGDGAGLVQDDRCQLACGLQRLAVADQDAELGGLAGADHDGGRGRQARARRGRR